MTSFYTKHEALINKVKARLSPKRFEHTLGVCRMTEILAEQCLPKRKNELAVAALLHDIAKELTVEEQMQIISKEHIILTPADTTAVLHSYVAPYIVKNEFSDFATPDILSAVANHTVGAADMSVFDEIIFLSDYIEEGRTYNDCVETREYVLSSLIDGNLEANLNVLHTACVMSIDRTCKNLVEKGKIVNPRSLDAKEALLSKIN